MNRQQGCEVGARIAQFESKAILGGARRKAPFMKGVRAGGGQSNLSQKAKSEWKPKLM